MRKQIYLAFNILSFGYLTNLPTTESSLRQKNVKTIGNKSKNEMNETPHVFPQTRF